MDRIAIRNFSFEAFGAKYRLEVAAAIGRLEGKPLWAKAIAEEAGLDANRTQEQVAHFAEAHLLILLDDPALRRKEYRAVDIDYWRQAAALLTQLEELDDLT